MIIDTHHQIGQRFGKCIVDSFRIRYRPGGLKIGRISCVCDCGHKFRVFQMALNPEKSYCCSYCKPKKPFSK